MLTGSLLLSVSSSSVQVACLLFSSSSILQRKRHITVLAATVNIGFPFIHSIGMHGDDDVSPEDVCACILD